MPNLKLYIEAQLKRGYSISSIKSILIKKGYPQSTAAEVDKFASSFSRQVHHSNKQASEKSDLARGSYKIEDVNKAAWSVIAGADKKISVKALLIAITIVGIILAGIYLNKLQKTSSNIASTESGNAGEKTLLSDFIQRNSIILPSSFIPPILPFRSYS